VAAHKYVLAIDAGSSGCRAMVVDTAGPPASSAHRQWEYASPPDAAPLGREFDPAVFWDIVCQVSRQSIVEAGVRPSDVVAVSSASQRHGLVFLDNDGNELYGGPNIDLRALIEGFSIDAEHGGDLRRITGHSPAFLFAPAKLQWFKANRPDVYDRIATMLTINNWILYRLCGRCVAEPSSDSDTGLVDIGNSCWSADLQKVFCPPHQVCPSMAVAGTCVGTVGEKAANQTGLVPGTPVVLGGADTQCGLLGMGVRDQGQVGIVAGWSAAIQMVTHRPIIDPSGRIWSSCHILPGKWVLESNAGEAGASYAWVSQFLFEGTDREGDTYAVMDRMAGETPPGSGGAVAFIGPRAMDMTRLKPLVGGVFFPITPSVTQVERKQVVRAVLENLCFAFKANCRQLEETSHLRIESVSIGGGLARSRTLGQMLADVMAMPVDYYGVHEVTSYGAAMCAAVGAGVHADLGAASEAMSPAPREVSPDKHAIGEYARCYENWLTAVKWLDSLSEEMT
jgi:autoinducer-2 kinase